MGAGFPNSGFFVGNDWASLTVSGRVSWCMGGVVIVLEESALGCLFGIFLFLVFLC